MVAVGALQIDLKCLKALSWNMTKKRLFKREIVIRVIINLKHMRELVTAKNMGQTKEMISVDMPDLIKMGLESSKWSAILGS